MSKNFLINIARLATNNSITQNTIYNTENHEELLENLQHHQVLPFLHHFKNIIQNKIPFISDEVFYKSQEQIMKNACRTMVYVDFLKRNSPPDFLLVKGFLLDDQFYGNNGLRTFNDLDIFIREENYSLWLEFLADHRFHKYGNSTDNFPQEIIKKYSFAQHFVNTELNIAIDLHLNISNKMHPFQFDFINFYENRKTVNINGLNIQTLDNEHLIIYLLYHTFKHYYYKLLWFIDLHKIFSSKNYNEKTVHSLIEKYGLKKIFELYLQISVDIFGNSGLDKDSMLLTKYYPIENKYINRESVISGEYKTPNSLNRLLIPLVYLPGLIPKIHYLQQQLFPPFEVLPEYYDNEGSLNSINYLKNRVNRIQRLFS